MQAWVILYAIGAAQAALLALALWRRPQNAVANRVLAGWVAVVCADLAVKAAYLSAPSLEWFRAFRFVWLFPWLYGSLFYLYVRTLVSGRAPRMRDAVHGLGFVAMAAITAPVWLATGKTLAGHYARYQLGWPPPVPGYDVLLFGYSLSYVGAAVWQLHRYRRALRARRSDADRWSLHWVEALAMGQLLIWAIALAATALEGHWISYFAIYAAVAMWVCVVGWFALVQPAMLAPDARDDDDEHADGESGSAFEVAPADDGAAPVVASSVTNDPRLPEVEARLQRLMQEDALFRTPALTIGQLARRSGYPEYLVSETINRRSGTSFWEWINQWRVDAVRAHLDDPRDTRTVLDIAYDCGFTAKSTFNSAFKRRVGCTPSAYRQRVASTAQSDR